MVERLTAVALLILTPYIVATFLYLVGKPRDVALSWLGSLYVAPAMAGFVLISVIHMRAGMQVIIEDYVHGSGTRLALLVANWIFCWTIGLLGLFAILKIATGNG